MRFTTFAAALGAPAAAAKIIASPVADTPPSTATSPGGATLADTNKGTLHGAYIVKFAPEHSSVDGFYQNLSSNGIAAVQRRVFQHEFFTGTSFHLTANRTSDLDLIGNFTQVQVRLCPPPFLSSRCASF